MFVNINIGSGPMRRKSKQKLNKRSKRRIAIFGTLSAVLIVFLIFTIGTVWAQIYQKYQEKRFYQKKLTELREEEEKLKVDVEKLQDDDYVARYAREKYLYSKDGEFIIQIPKDKDSKKDK